jgi:uncharacterized membrane protein
MGMSAAFYALYTGQYVLGMLILAYCQIQLAEAIIWYGIDHSNHTFNRIGTLYAKYTLPLHLCFVGLGIAMMSGHMGPLVIGGLFYIGVLFFYTMPESIKRHINDGETGMSFPSDRACMRRECQNNENRLQWPFVDTYYVVQTVLIYAVFLMYLPWKSSMVLTAFFTVTYIISRVWYKWSASSIWCFLSAILAPLLVWVSGRVVCR